MGQVGELKLKELHVGDRLPTFTRHVTMEKMIEFEKVVWDRGQNSHTDAEIAQRDGLSKPLASGQNQMAFLHELMERNFGDSWVYGGKISVRYIHPVYPEDVITPNAIVTEITGQGGRSTVQLEIWCENQNGQKTAAGKAWAGQPCAARSWLTPEKESTR
jgi:acyl dehydratase